MKVTTFRSRRNAFGKVHLYFKRLLVLSCQKTNKKQNWKSSPKFVTKEQSFKSAVTLAKPYLPPRKSTKGKDTCLQVSFLLKSWNSLSSFCLLCACACIHRRTIAWRCQSCTPVQLTRVQAMSDSIVHSPGPIWVRYPKVSVRRTRVLVWPEWVFYWQFSIWYALCILCQVQLG